MPKKRQWRVINRNDGTCEELDNATTLRLCRDSWKMIVKREAKPGRFDPPHWYNDKHLAVQEMGFSPNDIDYWCFCCAQVSKESTKGQCYRCALRKLWGDTDALGFSLDDAPCEFSVTSPYFAWKNGDASAAQEIVDFCNAELRRMHARMR